MATVTDAVGERPADRHAASVLLRRVLVLNEVLEFQVRRRVDTSETDLQAMQHLMRHRQMTPTALAEALHLSTAATTTVIDRLVRRGHAERGRHPADRRRTLITPEPDAMESVMSILRPMIDDSEVLLHAMSPEAQDAVVDYLEGVVSAMVALISRLESDTESQQEEP